jgi:hypothetical protein
VQYWQKQSSQNGNQCDHHQYFDQCKRPV